MWLFELVHLRHFENDQQVMATLLASSRRGHVARVERFELVQEQGDEVVPIRRRQFVFDRGHMIETVEPVDPVFMRVPL
jgi:peroxiredoxin